MVIENSRKYKVTKVDIMTGIESNYGTYFGTDVKLIIRGYHYNNLFFEKKNSNSIYIVEEV